MINNTGKQCKHPAVLGDKCLYHQKDPTHKPMLRKGYWNNGKYYLIPIPENIIELLPRGQRLRAKQGEEIGQDGE